MTECVACHECANSEAQHDSVNGAHSSFGRCGELVQGEGGGPNCADVIDEFVAERNASANIINGTHYCRGHCGPIVTPGCTTFFWGKASNSNSYTLNWGNCNVDTCNAYCSNPTAEACFTVPSSPSVGYPYPSYTTTASGPGNASTGSGSHSGELSKGAIAGIVIGTVLGLLCCLLIVAGFIYWRRKKNDDK